MTMSTYSSYFLPLPPGRKYSQPLKIRPFIQDRGGIHCCNESATGGTEQGSKVQSTSHSSLENSPCNSPMVSLQGSGLRDKLASRGYKEAKRGSHREEEFQEQKKGRSSKDSRCSPLLAAPLIQLLKTECFMGQPDHEERDKASWLAGS